MSQAGSTGLGNDGSDDDSDFEWGGSSGGITLAQRKQAGAQRTKAEQKQWLHHQKALAMMRVDNSAASWRAHAEVQLPSSSFSLPTLF